MIKVEKSYQNSGVDYMSTFHRAMFFRLGDSAYMDYVRNRCRGKSESGPWT
jgi:hypothetical protein